MEISLNDARTRQLLDGTPIPNELERRAGNSGRSVGRVALGYPEDGSPLDEGLENDLVIVLSR